MNKLKYLLALLLVSVTAIVAQSENENPVATNNSKTLTPKWTSEVTAEQRRIIGELIESMVLVEGNTFTMGSNDGDNDEKPTHRVTLSDCIVLK